MLHAALCWALLGKLLINLVISYVTVLPVCQCAALSHLKRYKISLIDHTFALLFFYWKFDAVFIWSIDQVKKPLNKYKYHFKSKHK